MLDTLRKRLRSEQGFTLIELLVVIIILGILLAIAIPSYLSFKGRANDSAAAANVRAAVPGLEAYAADHGTYVGGDLTYLQASYDAGIKNVTITKQSTNFYCINSSTPVTTWWKAGPSGDIVKLDTGKPSGC